MKEIVAAKIGNKSPAYVSKTSKGKIKNEDILNLLAITDEDFLYSVLANERMSNLCKAAAIKCKDVDDKLFAGLVNNISERLRKKI